MAGTRRQAKPPRQEIPHDRREQGAEDRGHRDRVRVHQSTADGFGDRGSRQGADEIEESRERDGLARGQHFRRNDGGNGVRGVVKAVYVLEDQSGNEDDQENCHGARRRGGGRASGVFQHDLENHVASIAGTVDGSFHQIIKFHEDDDFLGVVGAIVEVLDQR